MAGDVYAQIKRYLTDAVAATDDEDEQMIIRDAAKDFVDEFDFPAEGS